MFVSKFKINTINYGEVYVRKMKITDMLDILNLDEEDRSKVVVKVPADSDIIKENVKPGYFVGTLRRNFDGVYVYVKYRKDFEIKIDLRKGVMVYEILYMEDMDNRLRL